MNKLFVLPSKGKAVFAGDTHGDIQASRLVIANYLRDKYFVIFLGDYIDRGAKSKENIDYLLEMKAKHENIVLLTGNHEVYQTGEGGEPTPFWQNLTSKESEEYRNIFSEMPIAVSGNGFIGLHGGLPEINSLQEIEDIQTNDENFYRILWGDFRERNGGYLGKFLGRPKLGTDYFNSIMNKIGKNVLIRSHDPIAPGIMFNKRCLTITTSMYQGRKREIALINLEHEVKNTNDIEIIDF